MKINFTVELDKELAELIQSPIRNFFEELLALAKPADAPPVKEPPVEQEDVIKETPVEEKAPQDVVTPKPIPVVPKPEAPKPKAKPEGVKETILEVIQSKRTGIDADGIVKLTGFTGKQISNNMFHLKKKGLVKKKTNGKFVAIKVKELKK